MPKLTRADVRTIVDGEERFSRKWDDSRPDYQLADSQKPIGEWLTYMRVYLTAAEKAVTLAHRDAALHNLRCLLNLSEACAQHHGLPPRPDGDNTDLYE